MDSNIRTLFIYLLIISILLYFYIVYIEGKIHKLAKLTGLLSDETKRGFDITDEKFDIVVEEISEIRDIKPATIKKPVIITVNKDKKVSRIKDTLDNMDADLKEVLPGISKQTTKKRTIKK